MHRYTLIQGSNICIYKYEKFNHDWYIHKDTHTIKHTWSKKWHAHCYIQVYNTCLNTYTHIYTEWQESASSLTYKYIQGKLEPHTHLYIYVHPYTDIYRLGGTHVQRWRFQFICRITTCYKLTNIVFMFVTLCLSDIFIGDDIIIIQMLSKDD